MKVCWDTEKGTLLLSFLLWLPVKKPFCRYDLALVTSSSRLSYHVSQAWSQHQKAFLMSSSQDFETFPTILSFFTASALSRLQVVRDVFLLITLI